MQGNARFAPAIIVPGTLAANVNVQIPLPFACTLQSIQAVTSNDSDATLQVGTVADPDGIMTAIVVGDSEVPTKFDNDDWTGALFTGTSGVDYLHLAATDVLEITVDYDGAGGTAAHDLVIVVCLDEG